MFKLSKNRRLFFIIVLLALFYNLFFISNQFNTARHLNTFIASEDAKILDKFILAFRQVYQDIFIKEHVPLDEQNIKLLPVITMPKISQNFSKLIHDKAMIRTVSDRPRNRANQADSLEMETIRYFRQHPQAKNYQKTIKKNGEDFFYYATPLYVTKRCLTCHGERNAAPPYIRNRFDKAFGYRLGDLRGIIGIYLSQEDLKQNIQNFAYHDIRYIVIITLVGLALFAWLLKKFSAQERGYMESLEKEVEAKTKELKWQLYHDGLTNLPNRRKLLHDLQTRPAHALILINIDGFKEINDIYGHEIADQLLKNLADLIHKSCHLEHCTLYRMPGDEFALVIFDDTITETALHHHIKRLIERIQAHEFYIDPDTTIHLKVAIGASFDHKESLIAADMALKKAKSEHHDFFIYNRSVDLAKVTKLNLEWKQRIDEALRNDRIIPFFQPIVSTETGKVEIVEALIRIVDADDTVHTPFQFLDIAKKTRQYPSLTRRMVEKSLEAAKKLTCHISINLSYLDIINPETMRFIESKIEEFGQPERIHFEILESEGIDRYDDVIIAIHRFKEIGCSISLDDFGSGYSNFVHLANMDADLLKIDGSLIRDIDQNISSQIIVESILDFAKKLEMKTCAEFVGSKEVYDTVKEYGVDYVQGFYISEPKPLEILVKEFDDLV